MYIVNTETGDRVEVVIEPMQKKDYNAVAQSKRYPNFNWKLERRNTVFKLHTNQSEDILGLLSIEYFEKEQYIKINLIPASIENVGKISTMIESLVVLLLTHVAYHLLRDMVDASRYNLKLRLLSIT